ncbi:MAG: glycine cleavage system protein GcvH [Candidatus Nanopelagicales bacterium]
MFPDELRYSDEHIWVRREGPREVSIGLTAWAKGELGDAVSVELPEAGQTVSSGEVCGQVESARSVQEIYAPVDGLVLEANGELVESPELLDASPYGEGWLLEVQCDSPAAVDALWESLRTSDEYQNSVMG